MLNHDDAAPAREEYILRLIERSLALPNAIERGDEHERWRHTLCG
jgi:hypothetical protein